MKKFKIRLQTLIVHHIKEKAMVLAYSTNIIYDKCAYSCPCYASELENHKADQT